MRLSNESCHGVLPSLIAAASGAAEKLYMLLLLGSDELKDQCFLLRGRGRIIKLKYVVLLDL